MAKIAIVKALADTPALLQKQHDAQIKRLRRLGENVSVHTKPTPVTARINEGRWLFDCVEADCGSGVLAHPEWMIGRCFGCGAVYTNITFPTEWKSVEAALLQRARTVTRNWEPGSTVADLRQENADHGIAPPTPARGRSR
jgi:hypothetical protein